MVDDQNDQEECKPHHDDKLREYYQLNVTLLYIVNLIFGDLNKNTKHKLSNNFSCKLYINFHLC